MSIKTLRKRIALVAVSALGAGLMSVAPATAAAATAGALTPAVASNVCAVLTTAGAAISPTSGNSYANPDVIYARVGTTFTIGVTDDGQEIRISNGDVAFFSATSDATNMPISLGGILATANDTQANATLTVSLRAAGKFTIKTFDNAADTSAADTVTVNVVTNCSDSVIDMGLSLYEIKGSSYGAAADRVDDAEYVTDAQTLFLSTTFVNAYGANVPAGTWNVKVSSGAVVGISSGTPSCSTLSEQNMTASGANVNVAVCQATDYAPWSGTITLSYNGTVVLTKAATIRGALASITTGATYIGSNVSGRTSTYRTFSFSAKDSAGNLIASITPTVVSTTLNQIVTNVVATASSADIAKRTGNYHTCAATKSGSAMVQLKATSATGATITSAPFKLECGGALYTFSASLDKAAYKPGEVATLTIKGLDVNGAAVYGPGADDGSASEAESTRINYLGDTNAPVISGGSMTVVVTPTTADYFTNGVKTYQLKVGSDTGDFVLSVNLPDVDDPVLIKYSVATGVAAGVTNAEVLAAIVKLIASINKQIRALQKSLKR